ncbi:proteasome maturation [Brachionus plicatilis]|uniref:Proteasome maturation n=1 Tax=Brachionus plicatilis TaxID=10195 RepID=A0A3M7SLN0_BRAPC|nr:proteasome maturation [Brachionus plicatilis]
MENSKNSNFKENELGVQDILKHGFLNVKSEIKTVNDLEYQEKNFKKLEENNCLSSARTSQGLNVSFKLEMEKKFAQKISRLPALKSSNLMLSVLKGTDDTFEIENILNNQQEFCEHNYDLHSLMGYKF